MPPSACDECGLDYSALSPSDVSTAIRSYQRRYKAPLTRFLPGEDGEELLRRRPATGGWSALEYAAHVRNSFHLASESVRRVVQEDHPTFPPIDADEEVAREGFNAEPVETVADEVATAAGELADRIDGVPSDAWGRTASITGLGEIDALWLARNAAHEGHHHLLDIGRVMRAARQEGP